MKHSIARMLLGLAILAGGAGAQPGPPPGGGPGARLYDPKTVETVAGKVVRVERVAPGGGKAGGVHLELRTDADAALSVHLGPAWYLDGEDMKIAAGDRVEVRGSRVTIEGKPAVIAAEVKKGERTLVLRDDAGVPKWSGGRRGARP